MSAFAFCGDFWISEKKYKNFWIRISFLFFFSKFSGKSERVSANFTNYGWLIQNGMEITAVANAF